MKRVLSLFLLFLVLAPVFAWQNTYRASDNAVKKLMVLRSLSGSELPSVTYPVSADQMLELLSAVNTENLSDNALEMYRDLYDELSKPSVLIKFSDDIGMDLHLPVIVADAWVGEDDSFRPLDLYNVDVDLFFSPYFSGKLNANGTAVPGTWQSVGKLKLYDIAGVGSLEQAWPTQAYASVGYGRFNLTVGRDRLSAGNGRVGNLYLSENLSYTDFFKLSFIDKSVSYDMAFMMYSSYENENKLKTIDFNSPVKSAFAHRMSATLLNRINVALYEGAVLYTPSILGDIRAWNPFMFIHNYGSYWNGSTNNFGGLEVSATLGAGLTADIQVLVDQFKLSSEKEGSGDNALGFLLGLNGKWELPKGIIGAWFEGAYILEQTYLQTSEHDFYDPEGVYPYYTNDAIVENYLFNKIKESAYMGYPLGGDLISLELGSEYSLGAHDFTMSVSYTVKGPRGLGVNEVRSADAPIENNDLKQKTLKLTLGANGCFLDGIDYLASVSIADYKNYQHNSEKNYTAQFRVGCRVDLSQLTLKKFYKVLDK